MMFGPYALFPHSGFLDPWFYPGYVTNFSYLFHQYGLTYYVSRLPWILPGMAAFSIATPAVASLLLCAAIIAVSGAALYWAVRWHYGPAPAVLAAIALATNPYFMATAAWHYPDGPAIAYAMVALALYLRPRGRLWNSVLAAAALALAGFTNMAAAPMVLAVLTIPFWRHVRSLKGFLREAACAIGGVGAITLILMDVGKNLLHDRLFFVAQIDMLRYIQRTPGYFARMWGTGLGFLLEAFRLLPLAFLLILGLVLLITLRKPRGPLRALYAAAFTCALLLSYDQFVRDGVTLRVFYHSSYMLVPMFGFAGMALGELWTRGRESRVSTAILGAGLIVLPAVLNRWRPAHLTDRIAWPVLILIAAAGIVLAFTPRWPKATAAVLCLAVFLGPWRDRSLQFVWTEPAILHGSNLSTGEHADAWHSIMEMESYLKTHVDLNRRMMFWWDSSEPPWAVYTSAAAMNIWGFYDFDKHLSTGSKTELEQNIPASATFVHLTMHPERVRQRNDLLASRGIVVAGERQTEIEYRGNRFTVLLEDIIDMSHLH